MWATLVQIVVGITTTMFITLWLCTLPLLGNLTVIFCKLLNVNTIGALPRVMGNKFSHCNFIYVLHTHVEDFSPDQCLKKEPLSPKNTHICVTFVCLLSVFTSSVFK